MISLKKILLEQSLYKPPYGGQTIDFKSLNKFNKLLNEPGWNYWYDAPPDVVISKTGKDTFLIRTKLGNKSNEYKLLLSGFGASFIELQSIQLKYPGTPKRRRSDDLVWPGLLYPKDQLVAKFYVPLIGKILPDDITTRTSDYYSFKISGNVATISIQNDLDLYILLGKLLRGESSININEILEPIIGVAANKQKLKGVLRKIS